MEKTAAPVRSREAQIIKEQQAKLRADLVTRLYTITETTIERACRLYNSLTDPAALRTDTEHGRYRRAARKVRAFIERNFTEGRHFAESDHRGTLHPLR